MTKNNNTTLAPTKAVIFIIEPTPEQHDEDCSVEAQLQIMEQHCKKHNLEIIKQFRVIDNSIDSYTIQFNECLAFIKSQNEKIAFVSYKIDRLYDKFLDIVTQIDDLVKEGKITPDFMNIHRADDIFSTQHKLFYTMAVTFANAYKKAVSDFAEMDRRFREPKANTTNQ